MFFETVIYLKGIILWDTRYYDSIEKLQILLKAEAPYPKGTY